jgi:dihydrofolate synthase / folylpolyglutamate synthase
MDALKWLESLPAPKEWRLQRMHSLVESAGLDLKELKAVHVAGTNGKGSVCAMVERVARQKKKTALYVSPHLVRLGERIQVNGEKIKEDRLAELAEWAEPFQEKEAASFFETVTLIAFKHFLDEEVELAVIETGLGGRLDATNVLPFSLPVITNVSMDHSEKLGGNAREIAREKAAIIKGERAVLACKGEALAECLKRASKPSIVGEPENVGVSWKSTQFEYLGREWRTRLVGVHQARNAATAIEACRLLGFSDEEIAEGLGKAEWPGRFEEFKGIVLDGAHNPGAARALAETLRALKWRPRAVLAVMRGKDVKGIVGELRPFVEGFYCTQVGNERSLSAIELLDGVGEGVAIDDCVEAVKAAEKKGPVLATGSLFLAGDLKKRL